MPNQFNFFDFLVLLLGFLYGNLFAINYSTLNWNFFVLFFLVLVLEIMNQIVYGDKNMFLSIGLFLKNFKSKEKKTLTAGGKNLFLSLFSTRENQVRTKIVSGTKIYILVNTMKRGFLLGVFVEAFKVGS